MSEVDISRRGIVVVQIDGLSYNRFQRALRDGQMKYTRKLLRRRRLTPHRYLSQLPTSTPAFQGGFFYGDNENIPGFHFYDKRERRTYYMGQSDSAYTVEQQFKNPGLLQGGSVFSCVYNGAAETSLFIFSSLTAPQRWKFALRVWDILLLTLVNVTVVFRILGMAVVELGAGLWDLVKRVARHGKLSQELEQLAIRIGLSVMGREVITLGAVIDIHRQVPIIYVNFLGYDEHAHLRGPDSRFARWSLRAIDRCIRRIFLAAQDAERTYDFYILSDHGQCASRPFDQLAGESLAEWLRRETEMSVTGQDLPERTGRDALQSANALVRLAQSMPRPFKRPMIRYADYLRRKALERQHPARFPELDLTVLNTGPIAYVYWTCVEDPLSFEQIEETHPGLVERLAKHPAVGMISVRSRRQEGEVVVFGREGWARLGREGILERRGVLPFDTSVEIEHVARGICRVTSFARAGDLCLWGGGSSLGDVTFAEDEYGSHSGWTNEEIEAFILAPASVEYDFSSIREHAQFYHFFRERYCSVGGAVPAGADASAAEGKRQLQMAAAGADRKVA